MKPLLGSVVASGPRLLLLLATRSGLLVMLTVLMLLLMGMMLSLMGMMLSLMGMMLPLMGLMLLLMLLDSPGLLSPSSSASNKKCVNVEKFPKLMQYFDPK